MPDTPMPSPDMVTGGSCSRHIHRGGGATLLRGRRMTTGGSRPRSGQSAYFRFASDSTWGFSFGGLEAVPVAAAIGALGFRDAVEDGSHSGDAYHF